MSVADEDIAVLLSFEALQSLQSPAEAIAGLQDIVVEELSGSSDGMLKADAGKAQEAAHKLLSMVTALVKSDGQIADQSRLRHDLRTPINAIVGYTELILEEEPELAPSVHEDMLNVLQHARDLLGQIDRVIGKDVVVDPSDRDRSALMRALNSSLKHVPKKSRVGSGYILVIDDTAANRELLRRQLQRQGHSVITAASGREGLEAIEGHMFDLVIVDVLMPDLNGIDLLRKIKSHKVWRDLPVLVISGLQDDRAVTQCIKAGAEDYLQKPVDPVLLSCRVEACLERVEWRKQEEAYRGEIEFQRDRADALLTSMLPSPIISRLQEGETEIADRFESATIVFADLVNFTELTTRSEPSELVSRLADIFLAFDDIALRSGVEKIKTIGDAYMVASGVPKSCDDHADRAVSFARETIAALKDLDGGTHSIRLGIHTGPVIGGLIGRMRSVYDVWGDTVNIASRLESSGAHNRIHLSSATLKMLSDPGTIARTNPDLKGVAAIETFVMD